MKFRVYYEDTDSGGVVYHTNYIKFCERARSEVFFKNGFPLEKDGAAFVVRSLKAEFIKSAKLGDICEVKTTITEIKKASLKMIQRIFLEDEPVFELDILLVCVKNSKPSRIDHETLEFLKAHMSS